MNDTPQKPEPSAPKALPTFRARPTSANVIVLNEEGLDDATLARVLSPFSNSRRFVGIRVAAEAEVQEAGGGQIDKELTAFARASAGQK